MARIIVTSACYLGDVAPFIPPARRLAERGHDVSFLTAPGFLPVLADEPFTAVPYALDFSAPAMHRDPEHQRLLRHPFRNQLQLTRYWMRKGLVDDPEAGRRSILDALDGADAVVSHPTWAQCVVPAARSLGVRSVVGQLFPMMIPTSSWTMSFGWPGRNLGRRANRASWRFAASMAGTLMYDRVMNDHRRAIGQPPMRGNALLGWTDSDRAVSLVSRAYFGDEPPDWDGCELVGFSHWAPPGELDPAVDAFLDDGEPPVVVCLGTSAASAGETFRTIAGGLDAIGRRSLLLVGNEANAASLSGRAGVFSFAPVAQVLPRCRVAVVSGALGTLAAALSAGVPVVVAPQLFDQVWHGARVRELGVGEMALRPSKVAAAVRKVEGDPSYRERARELASAMAHEDGPNALADAVEAVLRSTA